MLSGGCGAAPHSRARPHGPGPRRCAGVTGVSIRGFGDHPILPSGATDIAVGDQHLPAWGLQAFSGFHPT